MGASRRKSRKNDKGNATAKTKFKPLKKVDQLATELKSLEAEKDRIEEVLRRLKAQKLQNMINDSELDDSSAYTEAEGDDAEGGPSDISFDDVSSLPSHTSRVNYEESDLSSGEESIMTEDFYHYDARGRRQTDDEYYNFNESGTALACYQNETGNANIPKAKKTENSNNPPAVMIEWARGKTYVPDANLLFDDVDHHHPTEISLVVADDLSFYDELSFSSGDDSKLAAAVTDMPMHIDLGERDDLSLTSGLHSEWDSCSISRTPEPKCKHHRSRNKTANISETKPPNNRKQKPLYQHSDSFGKSSQANTSGAIGPEGKQHTSKQTRTAFSDGKSNQDDIEGNILAEHYRLDERSDNKYPNEISISEFSKVSLESFSSELCSVSISAQMEQDGGMDNHCQSGGRNRLKKSKNKSKRKEKAILGNRNSDSDGADDLSAGELAVVRKREQEVIKLGSGDERPLQNISRRKKRRSFDGSHGKLPVSVAGKSRTGKGSKNNISKSAATKAKGDKHKEEP